MHSATVCFESRAQIDFFSFSLSTEHEICNVFNQFFNNIFSRLTSVVNMYTFYILYLAVLFIVLFILYLVCGRLVARVFEGLLLKVFKVQIEIERVQFLALRGVKINTTANKIEVDNIVLRTKWSFPGATHLFMLCFGRVTVTASSARTKSKERVQHGDKTANNRQPTVGNSRHERIACVVRFFSKYLGMYLCSLDVVLHGQPNPKFNIILQVVKGMKILFRPNESFLKYSITTTKFVSQLHQVKQVDCDFVQDVTLAEVAFNVLVEGSLGPLNSPDFVEELSVKVNPLKISLGDNFIKSIPLLQRTSNEQLALAEKQNEDNTEKTTFRNYSPKNFDVTFTDTSVYICDQEQRELSFRMEKLILTAAQSQGASPLGSWVLKTMSQLTGLKVQARGSKNLVLLNNLMVTAKIERWPTSKTDVSSSVYVESCHCNYMHEEISYWAALFAFKKANVATGDQKRITGNYIKLLSFENNMEIIDLTASLVDCASSSKSKPVCQAIVASLITNVVLPATDGSQPTAKTVNCSARLENAYVYFNTGEETREHLGISLKDNPCVLPSSRKHLWGRVLELGSSSLKCDLTLAEPYPSPENITVKCDASCLVLEYSQHTKQCLTTLLQTGEMYKIFNKGGSVNSPGDTVETTIDCEFTVHDINVFCVGNCEDGADSLIARLDVVSVTKCRDHSSFGVHGCKVGTLGDIKKEPFCCEKSPELLSYILGVSSITTNHNTEVNKIALPKIVVQWDLASHMALHDRISGMIKDGKELQNIIGEPLTTAEPLSDNTSSSLQFEITFGDVSIKMKTSSECSFGVQFAGVMTLDQRGITAESPGVSIAFDEKQIFQLKAFSLRKLGNIADVTAVRQEITGFESTKNKIWMLNTEVEIFFPYCFDFGKSLDKLLVVNKLLKKLYGKSSPVAREPLYADVWVNLTKVLFEIEDDPFEVKLGKNYELLSDEALQWIEREQLLEERINEVRKKPGNLLSDKKVEGLYYSLCEKKSKIYIERSVKLYEEDKRSRLCCWEFTDVNLMILADESMNGKDKIVPEMKRIDSESPFPSEDTGFTTLWCRFIKGTVSSSTFTLRDYQQALFSCESFGISGRLIGAEQAPAVRATLTYAVEIGAPWEEVTVTRGMTPLKYFHDLTFDFIKLEMTWGVDIEPAYSMVTIAFEHINKASVDPSLSLPFWDKMRLLLHGRLVMNIQEWHLNWRATRNPYDKSEKLEVLWRDVSFDWTNARFEIFGDFDMFTRTASSYDDCCVLHLPALRFCTDLEWHCRDNGDPNNHYNVRPCAPDKIPELPPGKSHDSYAAFRSQNLSLNVSFEVEPDKLKENDVPTILLYASTFRWFQNFQAVVWRNVSRPIKKGSIFRRILPKRRPLSRHYRNVGLNLKFPQLRLFYWGSFAKNLGAELNLGVGSLNIVYRVGIEEFNDGLMRRPAATWSIVKLDSEIDDVTCYVTSVEDKGAQNQPEEESTESKEDSSEASKFYLGHVDRLVYKRKEFIKNTKPTGSERMWTSNNVEDYIHNLVCHNFRGVWTLTNRKLSFGLVETYTRSQQLKRDLSADALKFVKVEKKSEPVLDTSTSSTDSNLGKESPLRRLSKSQTMLDELVEKTIGVQEEGNESFTENATGRSRGRARPRSITSEILLDQLVSETSSKFFVQTEEGETTEAQSSGYILCNSDDLLDQLWHIEFINSQVMLKGIENAGCLLVTAGNTKVLNRLHRPTQTGRKLLNKKSWLGHLENMQYFCTVRANDDISTNDIPWLDSNVIQSRRKNTVRDLSDLTVLGSGDSVGGMVDNMVASSTLQLQRIVARCGCQFYYASFDDQLEPDLESVPPTSSPSSSSVSSIRGNQSSGVPVNTFTLKHPALEISINSAQYALILDIVSNVLLHIEPQKKEVSDLEQRMGFYFQLSTAEDLKGTILNVQNNVRACLMGLSELRRVLYNLNEIMKEKEKKSTDEQDVEAFLNEMEQLRLERRHLETEVAETKTNLSELSTELRIMISAYKDFQTNRVLLSPEKARGEELIRVVEVCLDQVTWRLTQPDGQLQIVEANLTNLRYTNITMTNSSGAHSVEVGDFNMTNLMPNSPYKKVITPRGERRVGRDVAVRVYCRVKSPVGGIGVKDHFEVNLCPLNVGLTYKLYTLMMGYFFPGRAHEDASESGDVDLGFGVMESHADKDVFHEEATEAGMQGLQGIQKRTGAQKPERPSSLSLSDTTLSDTARTKMSSSSLDSPLSSLPSPHGTDKKPGRSRFYASLSETASKELDKMKERASQTNNFVYVKIPEIPICFSYKGEKEKNLVDVHNFRLNLPTLQYQNRTWTWLDLMMAVKKDYKQVLVGQVIKEKLHWKGGDDKEAKVPEEEDKAKILFGDKQSGSRKKKKKKSLLFKFGLKSKVDKTDTVGFSVGAVNVQSNFEPFGQDDDEERLETQSRSSDEGEIPDRVT